MKKQISFKRQIKHFWKQIQRNHAKNQIDRNGFDYFFSTENFQSIGDYFLSKGVSLYSHDVNELRLMKGEKFKRTSKLIKRLGKAALKKNSLVFYNDIRTCVNKNGDAREIPFYKHFKIVEKATTEYTVLAISEQHIEQKKYYIGEYKTRVKDVQITQI